GPDAGPADRWRCCIPALPLAAPVGRGSGWGFLCCALPGKSPRRRTPSNSPFARQRGRTEVTRPGTQVFEFVVLKISSASLAWRLRTGAGNPDVARLAVQPQGGQISAPDAAGVQRENPVRRV